MVINGVILHRSFIRQYSKQTEKIKVFFKERKNIFIESPFHPILNNHKLVGRWSGYSSINITGDVRAVYKVDENIAVFVAIGTHSQLYGK